MLVQKKRWLRAPQLTEAELAELGALLAEYNPTPLLLQLLFARQVLRPRPYSVPGPDGPQRHPAQTPDEMKAAADAYLNPDKIAQPDPLALQGMDAAVARIEKALANKEKIAVYGDFDCDGVTSATLLQMALKAFGGDVIIHIPHRVNDGYGLNIGALDTLAGRGVKLIVTVDCGISNIDEVRHGQELGMDLIVTDHHELPVDLPNCILINPQQETDGDGLKFAGLAGVGVAYQVVRALVARGGKPQALRNAELLELVAIGTVADIAPLKAINRILVTLGLRALRKTRRPGILALMKSASVVPENIDAEDIGFIIGPRLNAAGRMDDARSAYELLLTEKPDRAADLAQKLETDNRNRKSLTDQVVKEARKRVEALGEELPPVLVLRDASWPQGVLGLVASRLVDDYNRPAIVMQQGETTTRGSARSIKGFHIRNALEEIAAMDDVFVNFGGHEGAAGFTLRNEFLEDFDGWVQDAAEEMLDGRPLQAEITADAEVQLHSASLETCALLGRMEPFGEANSLPVFATKNLRVVDSRTMGADAQHLLIRVVPDGAPPADAIDAMLFKRGDLAADMAARPKIDLLYTLEKRCWQGETTVRLIIKDLRPSKE